MGGKIELKREKCPISLGIEGEFFQFVPDTSHHHLNTFFVTIRFSNCKIGQKLSKLYFPTTFKLFPQLLASPSPKLWTKFVVLLDLPISFGVKLD